MIAEQGLERRHHRPRANHRASKLVTDHEHVLHESDRRFADSGQSVIGIAEEAWQQRCTGSVADGSMSRGDVRHPQSDREFARDREGLEPA